LVSAIEEKTIGVGTGSPDKLRLTEYIEQTLQMGRKMARKTYFTRAASSIAFTK
jgi:hypothetical protein